MTGNRYSRISDRVLPSNDTRRLAPASPIPPTPVPAITSLEYEDVNLGNVAFLNSSTSVLKGGVLSINGGDASKFDITDGTVCIADNFNDPTNPALYIIEFTGLTANTVTDIATSSRTYVGIRLDNVAPSGGTATPISVTINGTAGTAYLVEKTDIDFTLTERREIAVLGLLPHPNNVTILFTLPLVDLALSPALLTLDLAQSIGPINRTGNVYSANGANLQINKSAGETFRVGTNYEDTVATRKLPNITTDAASVGMTYRIRYQNGSGGFTETGDLTNIDPDQYDDGTGTLASVGNNKWTIQWLFYFGATDSARFQYGQSIYNNFAEAEAALLGGDEKSNFQVDPNFLSNATLRGWLLVKKGATALNDTNQAVFLEAGRFEQTVVGGGTSSTTNLQQAYDNSNTPEIVTDATRGPLDLQGGTGVNQDKNLSIRDNSGTETAYIQANGATSIPKFLDLTSATAASGDKVLFQDVDDLEKTKYSTFSDMLARITPEITKTLLFTGALSSSTIDVITSDLCTWSDDSGKHDDITHTGGNSNIGFESDEKDLEIRFRFSVDGTAYDKRHIWTMKILRYNTDSVLQAEYLLGSSVYMRNNNVNFNEGEVCGDFHIELDATDYLEFQTVLLDKEGGATPGTGDYSYLNSTNTFIEIYRKEVTLSWS